MASESCIHPNCKCKSYKDPGHPNGTLLFLKLKCKQCGHHGSEHRKLTVVDNLVKDEVMKAAEVRCCHLVPLTDVPYSPVFKPHDPIPIPYDSSEYDQNAGVQCTCTGFQVSSLVKLLQSFRTYNLTTAISVLPNITCSTCNHTIQTHQPTINPPNTSINNDITDISSDIHRQFSGINNSHLTLKSSNKIAFTPFKGCVQVLPPTGGQSLTLVALYTSTEDQLHIIVNSVKLGEDNSVCVAPEDKVVKNEDEKKVSSDCTLQVNGSAEEGIAGSNTVEIMKAPASKRKRRRRVVVQPTRKSARLRCKGTKGDEVVAKRKQKEEAEYHKKEVERVKEEQKTVCGCVVKFVSSLEDRDIYTNYPLPQVICKSGVELMSVASSESGLILGLGTNSGQVFSVMITEAEKTLLWAALEVPISNKGPVKSMSWRVKCSDQFYLCTGYRHGLVIVWSISVTNTQIKHSVMSRHQDTECDITMSSWAPDTRWLAVGSQFGEVLFYSTSSSSEGSYNFKQRLVCGGSAITCATWMHDSSVLAVGGTDDSVHILSMRNQSTSTMPNIIQPSILSYFKPVDVNKFIHTHWLRGHCSFVSSLLPLDMTTLLSVGWDGHLLFWQGIDPINHSNGEVFPIEDNQPQCGFKLGASTTTEFLPLSVCDVAGFGIIVLLMDRARDIHLTYYTLTPISMS